MSTSNQFIDAGRVAHVMRAQGVDVDFIAAVLELARAHDGACDLMALWEEAVDQNGRDEAIADLQDLLEDVAEPAGPLEKPYLPYKELAGIAKQIEAHKKKLRELIDRNGGVSEVARKSGIPQPSLSRMLNSASMPRRTTLYRIANALGVPEGEIVGEWIR